MKKLILVGILLFLLAGCNTGITTAENELKQLEVKNRSAETAEGDFIFRLVSEQEEYKAGEPVKIYAEIEYVGDEEEIQIFHSSSPFLIAAEEKTRGYELHGAVNDIGLTP